MTETETKPGTEGLRKWAYALAILGATVSAFSTLGAVIWIFVQEPDIMTELFREHARALLGLPFAAISSFCLVVLLDVAIGPIEFNIFGMKFEGGSGPVVMSIFAFLAFVLGLKVLW